MCVSTKNLLLSLFLSLLFTFNSLNTKIKIWILIILFPLFIAWYYTLVIDQLLDQ